MFRSLRGLQVQLVLWAIAPLTVIVVGLAAVGIFSHQVSMRSLISERDTQLARTAAKILDERLNSHIQLLESNSERGGELPDRKQFDGGLLLLSIDGEVKGSSVRAQERLSRLEATQKLADEARQAGRPRVSYPFEDASGIGLALMFAVPLGNGDVILGVDSFDHLEFPETIRAAGVGQRGLACLVDAQDRVIYPLGGLSGNGQSSMCSPGQSFGRDEHGEEIVVGYGPLPSADWGLVIQEPWADAVAPLMRVSEMTPIVVVATTLVAFLVIFFGVRYIIRPLQELERQAQSVAAGDAEAIQHPVGGVEEIRSLHSTLNRMTLQVRTYQKALRQYLTALTHAEEDERQRVARELHDDTAQTLVALIHRVDKCETLLDDPQGLSSQLDQIRDMATRTLDGIRRLIYNLRPPYLEDLGLAAALDTLAREAMRNPGSPRIRVAVLGEDVRLEPEVELTAFRITQEGLSNALRHARAQNVHITLGFGRNHVEIRIEDDGTGFLASRAQKTAGDGHFGLIGMQERALRLGGHLSLESVPGHGTTIVATIPFNLPEVALTS